MMLDFCFVSENILVQFSFPLGNGARHRDIAGDVGNRSHHIQQPIERKNKSDHQERCSDPTPMTPSTVAANNRPAEGIPAAPIETSVAVIATFR